MITDEDGDKCSPKDLANEILVRCLERVEFWMEENSERLGDLTERELNLLNDQLSKQAKRCFKILGYKDDIDAEA